MSEVGFGFRMKIWKGRESLIVAAQNTSIQTNLGKAKTGKGQKDTLSRLCKKVDESIDLVVNGGSKLARNKYNRKHDSLGKIVHWKLARKCNWSWR